MEPSPSVSIKNAILTKLFLSPRINYLNQPNTDQMGVTARSLYIEVTQYDFTDESNAPFIGRIEEQKKLERKITPPCLTLDESQPDDASYQGSYLVAGYRGIGKSTLVKKVSNKLKDKVEKSGKKQLHVIDVYLSQGDLSDFDLLRQMFIQLYSSIDGDLKKNTKLVRPTIAITVAFLMSLAFGLSLPNIEPGLWPKFRFLYGSSLLENEVLVIIILSFLFVVFYSLSLQMFDLLLRRFKFLNVTEKNLKNKLEETNKRIHSGLEISDGGTSIQDSGLETTLLTKVLDSFRLDNGSKHYSQAYEKITVKELEFELKEILKAYRKLKKGYVLFIIDELDKLEPEFSYETENIIELGKSKVQSRRDSVAKLLANLKSFIHTADAKFVFIGGSEMYDASLADIADRESFYSSIFHDVIYINSFFKDWVSKKNGLSQMTEDYVIRNLLKDHKKKYYEIQQEIDKFYGALSPLDDADKFFTIYQLRRFIIFLTYRCNGSPKRLKELFESYLIKSNSYEHSRSEKKEKLILHYNVANKLEKSESIIVPKENEKVRTYFKLDYIQQYHIGFLYNIVTPYLLQNQKHFKLFSDKNLYLSAFLLDHILKFHRSAFSWRELELMPDIILGSKGPNLRAMMGSIVNYLLDRHFIRETTNAMFQYKFRSRASMEFKYISKISDENAAAFNFTYDESYHLKTFFKQKLKQKRLAHTSENSKDNNLSITISYLNSTIADLHYYDEEYESAIRYYNDSFEPLSRTNGSSEKLNNDEKVQFLRNRLLVSLCLEKTYRYDSTYSTLRNTIIESYKWDFKVFEKNEKEKEYKWEAPYKRMQLFLRPHLALLACIEKGRSDGITESNLRRNIQEYCGFMGLEELFPLQSFKPSLGYREFFKDKTRLGDHKRVQTLLSDYYQNIGSILFYKNRNFNSIHQKGAYGVWFEYLKIRDVGNEQITFEIHDNNDTVLNIQGLNYGSIQKVRESFKSQDRKYFFPSYACTFYYATAIGHILTPYQENLYGIFGDADFRPLQTGDDIRASKNRPYNVNRVHVFKKTKREHTSIRVQQSNASALKTFKTIERVLYNTRALHILSGKTAQSLGLVLSKLSDSILSSLGERTDFYESINHINKKSFAEKIPSVGDDNLNLFWFNFWNLKHSNDLKHIRFEKFFSIANVFYLNILSFRCYQLAGLYNDALFQLKKCLYILNTYCEDFKNPVLVSPSIPEIKSQFVYLFKKWLVHESNKLIQTHINNDLLMEREFVDKISEKGITKYSANNRLFSIDIEEIGFLSSQIEIKISSNHPRLLSLKRYKLSRNLNLLDNVYTRIQELTYNAYLGFQNIKPLFPCNADDQIQTVDFTNNDEDIVFSFAQRSVTEAVTIKKAVLISTFKELNLCFKNLLHITKTYGISYILSYSYLGSLHYNIHKTSEFTRFLEDNLNRLISTNNSDSVSKLLQELDIAEGWDFKHPEYDRKQAIDYYTKAVNLHAEGVEYKSMIKNMYILEDDFNDLLVHFCASLERSLINTGVVEEKMTFD